MPYMIMQTDTEKKNSMKFNIHSRFKKQNAKKMAIEQSFLNLINDIKKL